MIAGLAELLQDIAVAATTTSTQHLHQFAAFGTSKRSHSHARRLRALYDRYNNIPAWQNWSSARGLVCPGHTIGIFFFSAAAMLLRFTIESGVVKVLLQLMIMKLTKSCDSDNRRRILHTL